MANQIVISSGAKVRNLNGVLTGTTGVVNSLGINVANGIPQLDGSGKILVSQLPNSVMEYKGTWNAATNTPTLVNGTGNQGDVYLCNVAGTVNFGAGAITFAVGDQAIYSGTIWQKAGGSTGTVTSVAVTETGDALTITGSPITTSGTINIGFAGISSQYVNGAGGLTTFPSLTGYVPYTGATANVDLGTFDLTADIVNANDIKALTSAGLDIYSNSGTHIALMGGGGGAGTTFYGGIVGTTGSFASSGGSDTFAINHSSGSGIALNITKGGAGEGLYINKTSGSGNAATIIGTLNATTLVKSGGTSSQFLKADGSVDSSTYLTTSSAASTYVPYTGATANLNLGTFGITSGGISSSGIAVSHSAGISASSGATTINGDANGIRINPVTASNNTLSFPASGSRTYTYPNATGTLALTSDLSSYIQGSGTTNYVPKFTASGTIGNSLIYDTGSRIAIGGTSATYGVLTVQSDAGQFCIQSNTTPGKQLQIGYDHVSNNSYLSSLNQGVAFTPLALQPNGGLVGIGTATPTNIGGYIGLTINGTNGAYTYWNINGTDTGRIITDSASMYFDNVSTGALVFRTTSGSTERMRITSGGAIGMNTSSPDSATVLTLRESSSLSGALSMLNRNGNQRWSLAVDAFAVDDKYFSIIDNTNSAVRMVITPSGNVGIGTSSPSNILTISSGNGTFVKFGDNGYLSHFNSGGYILGGAEFNSGGVWTARATSAAAIAVNEVNTGSIVFFTNTGLTSGNSFSPTERMRITSGGEVCIGTTTAIGAGLGNIKGNATVFNLLSIQNDASIGNFIYFMNSGGSAAGNIANSAGGVLYLTSSDYRLKQDFKDYNGLNLISKIKTYDYELKCDNSRMYGVKAHELQEVIPYAVNGEKDAKEMQSVDYSKLVPVLVKAIQELEARIKQLENK